MSVQPPDPSIRFHITDPNQVSIGNTNWKIVDLTHKPSYATPSDQARPKGKHDLSKLGDHGEAIGKTAEAATKFFATLSLEDLAKIAKHDFIRIVTERDLAPMKFRHKIPLIGGLFTRDRGDPKVVKIVDKQDNEILSLASMEDPDVMAAADQLAKTASEEVIPQLGPNTIVLSKKKPNQPPKSESVRSNPPPSLPATLLSEPGYMPRGDMISICQNL